MQSFHSQSNDRNEADNPTAIPHLARAWESAPQVVSSVRRPSTLPDPHLYHEAIEPQAIFELDEEQKDGSVNTIFVVPFSCQRCKISLKQACSRARPACVRCRNAGFRSCQVVQGGYQRLPGPKYGRPSTLQKQSTSGACEKEKSESTSPSTQELTSGRSHLRRMASRVASSSQAPSSHSEPSVTLVSKRPPSPGSDCVPPRKKAQAKATSRKGKARCSTVAPSKEMDVERSEVVSAVVSASERSSLKWTFVNRHEKSSQGQERSIPSNTLIPRVWTNSLGGLLTVFPELAKSKVGFSWFQSETPILLLDTNHARGHWINSTTLNVDLLWDFTCHDSELEPIVEPDTEGSTYLRSVQPANLPRTESMRSQQNIQGLRNSYLPPGIGFPPTHATVSAALPAFNTQMLPSDGTPQYQGARESYAGGRSPIHSATQNNSGSAVRPTESCPSNLFSPPDNPPPSPSFLSLNGSLNHHMTSQRVPLNKPPEVETLLNSCLHSIPLLLWIRHDSELVPCSIPPAYAYLCMGFFFISDLRHVVAKKNVPFTTGLVQGQVCWSVTLQWAPGGEDALFSCDSAPSSDMTSDSAPVVTTRDLLHPWWFDPMDTPSQVDSTTPYRPRDLKMQFFSFIPLDLLAEFHPSESFPRGWFCKSCGMINIQVYFRHQICQSTACRSTRDKRIPPGKIDSLSSLRDPYQSNTLIRPTNDAPSVVVCDSITWDDGMQSWIYSVKNGVILCHVFTGNQEHLQEDATALLMRIQCDILLRKDDPPSPYFTHSTRLSHPSDGSETMVPGGTPDCVRIAYYALCDFVNRYGEMDKPRFGEVRIQAWVTSGTRKGPVLRASKHPIVIHCLGAEVVLKFTPKGYKDAENSSATNKGKGRAKDEDRERSPLSDPHVGPSRRAEEDSGNQTPFIPESEANEPPTVAENVDDDTAAMDTLSQCCSYDAGGLAIPDSNTGPGMEVAHHEVADRRGRKKNKVIKDKIKASVPEISMTLVHGDCVVLCGDDFEYQIVRTGTTILVIGFPEET
ncbi:hypothetical protein OG21DRAFT_1513652 [Imleria badia]|nr:hypothetical protein OG21DRAFT_1513652 [Imleria badia]